MRTRLAVSGLALLIGARPSRLWQRRASNAKADPTAKPSPTAPPGFVATAPTKPAEQADSAESAVEYGNYFVQLVQYAVRTRSIRPVVGEVFDQARCSTCRQLGTYIDELVSGGYWEIGEDLRVGMLVAKPKKGDIRVRGPFTYPASTYVTVEGKREVHGDLRRSTASPRISRGTRPEAGGRCSTTTSCGRAAGAESAFAPAR